MCVIHKVLLWLKTKKGALIRRHRAALTFSGFTGSQFEFSPLCSLKLPSNVSEISCKKREQRENGRYYRLSRKLHFNAIYLQYADEHCATQNHTGNGASKNINIVHVMTTVMMIIILPPPKKTYPHKTETFSPRPAAPKAYPGHGTRPPRR